MNGACNSAEWKRQYRGDTWHIPVVAVKDGLPEDLFGAELWFTLKNSLDDPDPGVLQRRYLVPGNELAAAGLATIVVPPSLTGIAPGTYYFDVQRVRVGSNPDVRTIECGEFAVSADVTRNTDAGPIEPDPPGSPVLRPLEFIQSSASAVWTINHNLGRTPITQVFSPGGVEFTAEIENPSPNQTRVLLAAPRAGYARLI